jgi:5-methylcytosine-specific restriction endonuclease McrA
MNWKNKTWLEAEYVEKGRTMQDIGENIQVNPGIVCYWLQKFNIPTRKNYNEKTARFDLLNDVSWLAQRYSIERISIKQLAIETGVSYKTARRYLLIYGISLHKKHVCLTKPVRESKKGPDSPTWKGGKSNCIDCGTTLGGRYKGSNHRCSLCKNKFYRGSRHHSWKPSKSQQACSNAVRRNAAYRDWRKAVYERDDYTCVLCNVRGGSLHAHHLNCFASFPEQRYDVFNGVTLCEDHHLAFHSACGMGGNTAEQFQDFSACYRNNTTEMTY